MEMAVNEARGEISAFEVDYFLRLVVAEADHAAVIHGDMRSVNLTAKDIDEVRVFEDQFGGPLATGDAEFLLEVAHDRQVNIYHQNATKTRRNGRAAVSSVAQISQSAVSQGFQPAGLTNRPGDAVMSTPADWKSALPYIRLRMKRKYAISTNAST